MSNPNAILPLSKDPKGRGYLTANNEYLLQKEGRFWRVKDPQAGAGKTLPGTSVVIWGGVPSISPQRTLKDLVGLLQGQKISPKIRPLRKIYKGRYRASSGHFLMIRGEDGLWYLIKTSPKSSSFYISSTVENQVGCSYHLGELESWAISHGLDYGFATLHNLVSRLEIALESDPPM